MPNLATRIWEQRDVDVELLLKLSELGQNGA
jgi:hypothetical protein